MSKVISCTVPNSKKVEVIISRLRMAEFPNRNVSVIFAKSNNDNILLEKHSKLPEGAATGGSTGGVVGGVLGWLVGIGSLAIPGVGPFIAAGPLMAALSGTAVGAAVGGFIGSMVGLGIPELEAKHYASKLKEGYTLITLNEENEDRRKIARDIFKESGGEDISEATGIAAKVGTHLIEPNPVMSASNQTMY